MIEIKGLGSLEEELYRITGKRLLMKTPVDGAIFEFDEAEGDLYDSEISHPVGPGGALVPPPNNIFAPSNSSILGMGNSRIQSVMKLMLSHLGGALIVTHDEAVRIDLETTDIVVVQEGNDLLFKLVSRGAPF